MAGARSPATDRQPSGSGRAASGRARVVRRPGEHEGAQVQVVDRPSRAADDAQRLAGAVAVQPGPGAVGLGAEAGAAARSPAAQLEPAVGSSRSTTGAGPSTRGRSAPAARVGVGERRPLGRQPRLVLGHVAPGRRRARRCGPDVALASVTADAVRGAHPQAARKPGIDPVWPARTRPSWRTAAGRDRSRRPRPRRRAARPGRASRRSWPGQHPVVPADRNAAQRDRSSAVDHS